VTTADPLSRALAEFSQTCETHGVTSDDALACFRRYRQVRGFPELAAESLLLRLALRRPAPETSDARPGVLAWFAVLSAATAFAAALLARLGIF
jgi:hypothetical protein